MNEDDNTQDFCSSCMIDYDEMSEEDRLAHAVADWTCKMSPARKVFEDFRTFDGEILQEASWISYKAGYEKGQEDANSSLIELHLT